MREYPSPRVVGRAGRRVRDVRAGCAGRRAAGARCRRRSSGVAAPAGSVRYVTIPAPGGTMVERIQRSGGRVLATRFFAGTFTIPAVAYDGSASGLSGDRQTLVLIEPRRSFPRERPRRCSCCTRRASRIVRSSGCAATSASTRSRPTARALYLIQYLSPTDPTRYAVRSFDLARDAAGAEADRRSARARREDARQPAQPRTSADGRWAYTLYDGGGAPVHPRARHGDARRHAASTSTVSPRRSVSRLRLRHGRRRATWSQITDGARPLLALDTRTFAVVGAGRAVPRRGCRSARGSPLPRCAGARCRPALLGAGGGRRTRRSRSTSPPSGSRRRRFVWLRRFFSSSRRSWDAFVGCVARRGRRTVVASRNCSRMRSVARPRFRSCERSSWAIARTTGPSSRARGAARVRSAPPTPRRRTAPRPASSSSARAGRPGRSSARTGRQLPSE